MNPAAGPRTAERPVEVAPDGERCRWYAGRCEWPVHSDERSHYTEYRDGDGGTSVWHEAEARAGLDVERLARALHDSDMIRRYKDYADRVETMGPSPEHDLCLDWAAAIAAAYGGQARSHEAQAGEND